MKLKIIIGPGNRQGIIENAETGEILQGAIQLTTFDLELVGEFQAKAKVG